VPDPLSDILHCSAPELLSRQSRARQAAIRATADGGAGRGDGPLSGPATSLSARCAPVIAPALAPGELDSCTEIVLLPI